MGDGLKYAGPQYSGRTGRLLRHGSEGAPGWRKEPAYESGNERNSGQGSRL